MAQVQQQINRHEAYLRKFYGIKPLAEISRELRLAKSTIQTKCSRSKIRIITLLNPVTEQYLRDRFFTTTPDVLAVSLGCSYTTIVKCFRRLGLKKPKKEYSVSQLAYIKEWYREMIADQMAFNLDLSVTQVYKILHVLHETGEIEKVKINTAWSAVELEYLRDRYPQSEMNALMTSLNRTITDIVNTARLHKIKRIKRRSHDLGEQQ